MLTQEVKQEFINEAIEHREQDLLIKGMFWDGHKGCSVGCFVKTEINPHKVLANRLEVPDWIIQLQDNIFEGLPEPKNIEWHTRFANAMPVGLSDEQFDTLIKRPFLIFVLESTLDTFDHKQYPAVKKVIDTVIKLYKSGETDLDKFKAAAHAARAAARAARAAARAAYAAHAAARAAARAAYAAYATARAAYDDDATARAAADVADVAYATAHAKKFERLADKLAELMEHADKSTNGGNEQ